MPTTPSQHPTLAYIDAQKTWLQNFKLATHGWQKRIDSEKRQIKRKAER